MKSQASQDGGTGEEASSSGPAVFEGTGASQGLKTHTKSEWLKVKKEDVRTQLSLRGLGLGEGATIPQMVDLLAEQAPDSIRASRTRSSPQKQRGRARSADDVQLTGVSANKTTDMSFWESQSANELRAQITFRQGRRADWAVKTKAQLLDLIRKMIAEGKW